MKYSNFIFDELIIVCYHIHEIREDKNKDRCYTALMVMLIF